MFKEGQMIRLNISYSIVNIFRSEAPLQETLSVCLDTISFHNDSLPFLGNDQFYGGILRLKSKLICSSYFWILKIWIHLQITLKEAHIRTLWDFLSGEFSLKDRSREKYKKKILLYFLIIEKIKQIGNTFRQSKSKNI